MYKVNELNYPNNYLEPIISSRTIDIHHNKHHKKYLDNLNILLKEANYDKNYSKEELVKHIDMFDIAYRGDILYNLGGVLNHDLYFDILGYKEISGKFKEKIISQYKSVDNFIEEYIKQTKYLVGSGYTFLVLNKDNDLEIINLSNQETPYSYGLIPIMTIDLWEHAYYLDYQNRKDDYVKNFFSIINYDKVNEIYLQALQDNLQK